MNTRSERGSAPEKTGRNIGYAIALNTKDRSNSFTTNDNEMAMIKTTPDYKITTFDGSGWLLHI